jgi:catechol 2,3-dioxygenase-like lactoylglutathione lyase family enzyme
MAIDFSGPCTLLQVFDMPTSVRFYRDVLGLTVTSQSQPGDNFNWGWLKGKGVELMLNTAYEEDSRPATPDPARVAAHGDTCLFFGCKDLDGAYQHLRTHGLKVNPPKVAPYGMKQLYVTDPDGYGLCFQWPVTQETYDAWVAAYGLEPKTVG